MDSRLRTELARPFRQRRDQRHSPAPPGSALATSGPSPRREQDDRGGPEPAPQPIAIVGLACRFPDADDPAALLDVVLTGRRAFRRMPQCRLDLGDYYDDDRTAPDATYSSRAALLEGWEFDRAAFGVPERVFQSADPAQWLALETAARALAAAGFPGGAGLDGSRAGVVIGNTLTGDGSRAAALRLRWPYVRRVLSDALADQDIPGAPAAEVVRSAGDRYLAPFPPVTGDTLAGSAPATIAARICARFGFRGGGHAVDGSHASSLLAVVSAATALAAGDLDVALAGGVDLSLDPLELVGLAKAQLLAAREVRVYDESPTGFLPGEGCGVFVLMRTADARAAELPVYAEIAGWGVASAAGAGLADPDSQSQLLALRRAYHRAGIDPAEVQLIEGQGTGTAAGDTAELTALGELRDGARARAALGSITANIGHTRAAAGAAGLIKTVLAISNGLIPAATGCRRPHPLLRDSGTLRLPAATEPWPDGIRIAGVSAVAADGSAAHLVLRREPDCKSGGGRARPPRPRLGLRAGTAAATEPRGTAVLPQPPAEDAAVTTCYLLHAPDRAAMAAAASRIADCARWLSDAELCDLACQLARDATAPGRVRVAIVASSQEQLATRASEAIAMLPGLSGGLLSARPGIFAADGGEGRVTLLLPGSDLPASLAGLRWLDQLGVDAAMAVGHDAGEIPGLVWAGCLADADCAALAAQDRPDAAAAVELAPPRRRLILASTGSELRSAEQARELLTAWLATRRPGPARAPDPVQADVVGASLLFQTDQDQPLTQAAGESGGLPAVSLGTGPGDRAAPQAAAALFAAGALQRADALVAGYPSRPIDIWRTQTFIASPCEPAPDGPAAVPQPAPRLSIGRAATAGPARPQPGRQPAAAAVMAPAAADSIPGIGPWARCFAEQLREPDRPVPAGNGGPWRVRAAIRLALSPLVDEIFEDDPRAECPLAVVSDPVDPDSCAVALAAARDAVSAGQLVLITHGPGFTGFLASLHAERPELGITVLRVPESADGLRAARQLATAEPGRFRELVIDSGGRVREPELTLAEAPGSGPFPLGPDDVLLVSRAARGAGLALAQVLACCGAPIAVIGRGGPGEDTEVAAGLEQLRSAGARIAIEVADPASPADMAAALQRIEARFGPVTIVGHAAGGGAQRPVAELTDAELRGHVAGEISGLEQMLGAISTGRLRLIATFGSLAGRYGLAGEGLLALASGSLAELGERLAARIDGCRAMHVDWPAWAGSGLGDRPGFAQSLARAGTAPVAIRDGSRLLLKMLATPELPSRITVHGRIGTRRPAASGGTAPVSLPGGRAGRFLERVLVHYPGVELVCEARLSLRSDPYLGDHRVDGMPVLPATMALEAMAQAASALAGRPLRRATSVSMDAPVVVPAGAPDSAVVIRICALRDRDSVTVALRCEDSGLAVDHFRAVFSAVDDDAEVAAPSLAAGLPELEEMPASHSGIVDGTELYGPICFQSGRLRRVALLPEVTSRSCRALVRGGDDQPWFGGGGGQPAAELILGSPGLNDACWHVVQACVPHRRLLPAGCDSVTFSGIPAAGAVEVRAVEVIAADGDAAALVPRQAPPPGSDNVGAWDVEAVDGAGRPLAIWRGLRLADVGPLPRNAAWPPSLLAVYLERSMASLGLGRDLRVTVQCSQPDPAGQGQQPGAVIPRQPSSAERELPDPLQGFTLSVRAASPAACGWASTEPGSVSPPGTGPSLAEAGRQLGSRLREPTAVINARLAAIAACLSRSGTPASTPLVCEGSGGVTRDDWVVLRAGAAGIGCTVVEVSGMTRAVAIAIMVGGPAASGGASAAAASQATAGEATDSEAAAGGAQALLPQR
jgi:3-oxoacyl-(acyl-carrier-protein) synthase/NADP-dependent 3-hydroxy acid dehydrogenase YdfG